MRTIIPKDMNIKRNEIKLKILLNIIMYLFILMLFINCNKVEKNNNIAICSVDKMDILLKDLFHKRYLYRKNNSDENGDSTFKYIYLISKNLTLNINSYYFSIYKFGKPDSVKLNYVSDTTNKYLDASKLILNILDINSDTTKINLKVIYSSNENIALTWATYNYQFDLLKCKWYLKDSTFNQY